MESALVTCFLYISFILWCVYMHVYIYVHVHGHMCHMCVSRAEESFQESVFAFHHVGAKYQTQVIKLGGKQLYPYCFSEVKTKG